jgi:hypothetical protein
MLLRSNKIIGEDEIAPRFLGRERMYVEYEFNSKKRFEN